MNVPSQSSTGSFQGGAGASSNMGALLKAVIAAVKLVTAEEIMPRYLRVAHQHKSDGSLCTEADIAAQNALSARLQAILNVPVLGEEMSEPQQQALWAAGHDGLWCIDPIDGTTNFVRGLPYFAVSVALLRDGKSVLEEILKKLREKFCAGIAQVVAFWRDFLAAVKRSQSYWNK